MIRFCFLFLAACAGCVPALFAQYAARSSEPVIELPPFVITKTLDGKKWRYAQIDGYEILSQCSVRETREIVTALWRGRALMLPKSFWPEFSVPMTVMLFDQEPERGTELFSLDQGKANHELAEHWTNLIKRTLPERESFSLNLWRSSFNYSPTFRFHTKTLLNRRSPEVPSWLKVGLFGVYGVYREGTRWHPGDEQKRTHKAWWWSEPEARQAREIYRSDFGLHTLSLIGKCRGIRNADLRKFIPPLRDLLEQEPPRDDVTTIARWASANALFVRWGVFGRKQTAFWKFAERACSEKVNEALFHECFGMTYQEVRLELSCYLPVAVEEDSLTNFQLSARPPTIKLRDATPLEIARLRGEWERLEAVAIEPASPPLATIYREQAERTFTRVYAKGERDPRLLASMGLLYSDQGRKTKARPFLENAAQARVAGPEVYFRLARMQWDEFVAQPDRSKSLHALDRVTELLRVAEAQAPALAENYDFLAHVVAQRGARTEAETDALKRGR